MLFVCFFVCLFRPLLILIEICFSSNNARTKDAGGRYLIIIVPLFDCVITDHIVSSIFMTKLQLLSVCPLLGYAHLEC